MGSIAFAVPVKPGKTADAEKLTEMLTKEQAPGHHETSRSHGAKRIKIYHQERPSEQMVIYIESDDIPTAMKNRAASDHEFDQWFGKMIEEITGYHPDQHFHEPPSQLLVDWHEEKGHSARAEHR